MPGIMINSDTGKQIVVPKGKVVKRETECKRESLALQVDSFPSKPLEKPDFGISVP